MNYFAAEHSGHIQDLGAKRVLVKLKCLVRIPHRDVWSESMKSIGNSFDWFRHKVLLRHDILAHENVNDCKN